MYCIVVLFKPAHKKQSPDIASFRLLISKLYTRYEKQTNLKSFCPLLRRICMKVTSLTLKKSKIGTLSASCYILSVTATQ